MFHTLPDLLDADTVLQVQRMLAAVPQADWADGRESAGPQARRVKANQQLPHAHAVAVHIRTAVLQALEQSTDFLSVALPRKVFTPRTNRYTPDFPHYGVHIDNAIRLRSDGERVRTDLSCTVFLNDPADYDGGELVAHDGIALHRAKLPAGHAVLYPGNTLHEVTPVTRGQRLACFFWVESMVRSDRQRHLLHSLDTNLQHLRTQLGDTAQTTALTGLYHNLLREWAST